MGDMKRTQLEDEIRSLILSCVDVDGLSAADLPSQASLFSEEVGLDSIDALEIGAALRKKYHVTFKAHSAENREHFKSIASLASFIAAQTGETLED